jgi:quinoprotein glucose dehydrogenase
MDRAGAGSVAALMSLVSLVIAAGLVASSCGGGSGAGAVSFAGPTAGWPSYGGDPGGMRYSPLTQIDRGNVDALEVAWTFHTGETLGDRPFAFEVTPILVGERLVFCTPWNRVIALDPETGAELWRFDPELDPSIYYANQFICRGVSAWTDPEAAAGAVCRDRLFMGTNDGRLMSIDTATGARCEGFGEGGEVDLTLGVGKIHRQGDYQVTSPPAIARGLVITGSAINDNQRADEASGVVRAYDARTGALRWAWDPAPPPIEMNVESAPVAPASGELSPPAGGGAWTLGTANVWSVISVDEELGLVYLPTGNAAPDYWAADRQGKDYWSSSVVALHADTGQLAWRFQTVHHDLWDFDIPAQPTLVTLRRNGGDVPALVQATKMGILFVLDRRTGESLFPIEERPVPQTDVPGEITSPTQPFPSAPPPLTATTLDPDDAFGLLGFDRRKCRDTMKSLRWDGMYTPPSLRGSLMFPGNAGGTNWGGIAVDPTRGLAVANVMNLAWSVRLIPRDQFEAAARAEPDVEISAQYGTPYGMRREMLVSPLGIPCTPPPWGTLSAVDLDAGEIRWQVTFGTIRDIMPIPMPVGRWGTPNIGGPVITAGGIVFIGAAVDNYLRAFDLENGDELWKGRLPAGPQATPMTYRLRPDSRQMVVIAAGGHQRAGTDTGDAIVAFALPR